MTSIAEISQLISNPNHLSEQEYVATSFRSNSNLRGKLASRGTVWSAGDTVSSNGRHYSEQVKSFLTETSEGGDDVWQRVLAGDEGARKDVEHGGDAHAQMGMWTYATR